jgi:hypothetical protein
MRLNEVTFGFVPPVQLVFTGGIGGPTSADTAPVLEREPESATIPGDTDHAAELAKP